MALLFALVADVLAADALLEALVADVLAADALLEALVADVLAADAREAAASTIEEPLAEDGPAPLSY
jgi:hypothetical protein